MAIERHNVSRSPCSTSGAPLVQTSEVSTGGYLLKRSIAEYFRFSLVASSPESRKPTARRVGRADALVQEADHALASYFSTFETIEFRGFNQEWITGRPLASASSSFAPTFSHFDEPCILMVFVGPTVSGSFPKGEHAGRNRLTRGTGRPADDGRARWSRAGLKIAVRQSIFTIRRAPPPYRGTCMGSPLDPMLGGPKDP